MAASKPKPQPKTIEPIVITQVVGVVHPGDGDAPMLGVAYDVAARFITANADGVNPIELQWRHGDATFEAIYRPDRPNDDAMVVDDVPEAPSDW